MPSKTVTPLALSLVLCCCAGPSALPKARQSTLSVQELAPLARLKSDDSGLERFWKREGVAVGKVKWDSNRSRTTAAAPADLMQEIRDEVGRLNQADRAGEDIWLTVNVYQWKKRLFSTTPRASVEIIGRDQVGQVVWMGQGEIIAKEELAESLADSHVTIVAKELVRRLRQELAF